MESDRRTAAAAARFDGIERMLAESGRDLGSSGARLAVGRTGVALGFHRRQMLHVSWWALSALAGLFAAFVLVRRL